MAEDEPTAHSIMVSSLVSHRTGDPLVNFHSASPRAQLTPAQARHLAQSLIEAAEAAEQDAFLVRYLRTQFDLSEGQAATFLMDYRAAREAGQEGPASP